MQIHESTHAVQNEYDISKTGIKLFNASKPVCFLTYLLLHDICF